MEQDEYSTNSEPQEEKPARKVQTGIRSIPVKVVDEEEPSQEEPMPTKRKKRVISPEAKEIMLENLRKAREAKAKKLRRISQYPKEKRDRAVQMNEAAIERRAQEKLEKLAEETLRRKEEEKELTEYRIWKQQQQEGKAAKEITEEKPKRTKAKPKAADAPIAEAKSKKAKAKKKAMPQEQSELKQNSSLSRLTDAFPFSCGFDMSAFLD